MQQELGIVISTPDSPSTTKICFVCIDKPVHKGQYVQIKYIEGTLIGLVTDIIKINRYFENQDSIKEFENNSVNIFDQFPINEWEFLQAVVKPLGVFSQNNMFSKVTLPVSPGDRVYVAEPDVLSKFLHFKENGLNLGMLEFPKLDVKFDLDRLLQKHLAILAQSGAGKSYLTSVILEELLDRPKEQGRIAAVLIDVHGEYSHFSEPLGNKDKEHVDYSSKTRKINCADIKIGCTGLTDGFFFSILPNLSNVQKRELSKVIKKLKDDTYHGAGPYGLEDIITEIKNSDIKENISRPLIDSIYELENYKLFGKIDQPSIFDVVQPGILTIIDFSKEINLKKKQIIVYYFAHSLFYGRMHGSGVPPFLFIVEEAHQFAPETAKQEKAFAKPILETIAREGRKFGASLCLISQRPVRLSATILSQANTHIILRITNPNDLKHIGQSSEGLDQKSLDMINSLPVGEALVVGEASSYPVFFKVRQKKSQDSHLEVSLSGLARSFEEKEDKKNKDIESFM
ncbi:MAG TPA: ATP-binding protein [Candidatus Diapherotrites archaeon]|nr:ATP-binding protein [Candidatus Diapherotrites archaeon]